jgi:ferredoxin
VSDDPSRPPPPSVKVKVHPGLCEGWGECHRWAPLLYPLDGEGKVDLHVMEVPGEHAEDAWLGAVACPARAISIIGPPTEYWSNRFRPRREFEPEQR